MNFIFVFILPSVFGFKLMYDNLNKKDKLTLAIYECILLVISNLICTILVLIKNSEDCSIVVNAESSIQFSVIYIILSIFVGCIVGFIITVVDKYFSVNIEVKHEGKKSIKNNK